MERDRTEERIDRLEGEVREFRVETNARFDKVTAEFVAVRKEIKEGFESQQRTMFHGALMLCGTMIGCFGAMAGLIAAVV